MRTCLYCGKVITGRKDKIYCCKVHKQNARIKRKNIDKKNYHKNNKKKVRIYTRNKYGKLPNGFQYHHTTEPYNIDEWICVNEKEHQTIFH